MSDDSRGKNEDGKLLYCSFCGKSQHEVRKLIAGPSVFICDECVELCNDIIREELEDSGEAGHDKLPKPQEINAILDEGLVEKKRGRGMFITAGARKQLLKDERQRFLNKEWPRIAATIERLGLNAGDLLAGTGGASAGDDDD